MITIGYRTKRSRKSAPKSRQGCVTCKNRHVKCDESRPYCKRCAKAGRTCLGYAGDEDPVEQPETQQKFVPKTTKAIKAARAASADAKLAFVPTGRGHPPPSGLPVRLNSTNKLEIRFLEYFFTRTAPAISGFFDAKFYNRILLQAGQYEPAIRHGMMAVGAMHEHFEFSLVPTFSRSRSIEPRNEKPAFALHQYNKAISEINKQLSSGLTAVEPILMCCLLFVCLDCLRGETTSAVSHLRSGGNIITNWKPPDKPPSSPAKAAYLSLAESSTPTDSSFVNEYLLPIFERLSCHVDGAGRVSSSEFANLVNPNLNAEGALASQFRDIDEARASIMNLGSVTVRFIKGIAFAKYSQQSSQDEINAVAGLQLKLQRWQQSMESLLERNPDLKNSRRARVLNVQHRLFTILAATSLHLEQSANDSLTEDFEFIVTQGETLSGDPESRVAATGAEEDLHSFSFEEGVAPACFYTASKCRVPHLRRRAISLLRSGPCRQGIWNAVLLATVADRITELEEGYTPPDQALDTELQPLLTHPVIATNPDLIAQFDPCLSNLPLTPESLAPLMPDELLPFDPGASDKADASEASLLNSSETTFESSLPSECARIHHADIKESPNGSPYQHQVTFFRKPNGLDQDWEIWTEHISI